VGEVTIIRWTAPASGSIQVAASFQGFWNEAVVDGDVHVLHNNVALYNSAISASPNPAVSYSGAVTVTAGDTIDFVMGYGQNGTNSWDRGIVSAQIQYDTTPAPAYSVQPLYDESKAVRSGRTLPIKLQLLDGSGNNVSSASLVVHAVSLIRASDQAPGVLEDAGQANPDANFRYDATLGSTGGYIFNLSLRGYPTGTYNLNFTAGSDPVIHSVQFQVK
jgi:hypothetical protein